MTDKRRGNRVVLGMFALLVSVAGLLGFIIGLIRPADLRPVPLFGLVWLEPTPVGLAVYGMLTVGAVLAVGLALVMAASRYAGVERPG